MLGALIGDIVGSRFEFNNIKTKDFILFTNECTFTDDSLMTLAVAKVLMDKVYNDKNKIIDYFKYYGRKYNVGYGASFLDGYIAIEEMDITVLAMGLPCGLVR